MYYGVRETSNDWFIVHDANLVMTDDRIDVDKFGAGHRGLGIIVGIDVGCIAVVVGIPWQIGWCG